MNAPNRDRIKELDQKRSQHKLKISKLNDWLLKNFNHPDRLKVFTDKAYYECEVNRIDKKIQNLNYNNPENGYCSEIEQTNVNRNQINNIIS